MKPTMGSLFAGIGGFDLGFERAGFETKWQVEIDPWARKVLAKNFPHAERYEDVREVGKHNLEPVDVICGGFPCQDVSNAGNKLGIGYGTRSGLYAEMLRIVDELRPRFLLMENVAALLGRGLGRVLGDLVELGFDSEWECIPAAYLGAPHVRDRVYVLSYPAGQRQPESREHFRILSENAKSDTRTWNGRRLAEPDIQRVVDGVPRQLDRLRGIGNAVVPQIAEMYARRIKEPIEQKEAAISGG